MIQLKDISLSFGSRDIFKNLSWHIKDGKRIGLFGPNGVGKTTLAEMMLVEYMMRDWQLVSIHQNVSEGLRSFQENPKAKVDDWQIRNIDLQAKEIPEGLHLRTRQSVKALEPRFQKAAF